MLNQARIKRSKFDAVYKTGYLMDHPRFHAVSLLDIEQLNRTTKYKRSFGAAVVKTLTLGGIAGSSLLLLGGLALHQDHPRIGKFLVGSSLVGLAINIPLHLISKPKKYKIRPDNRGWIIINKKNNS